MLQGLLVDLIPPPRTFNDEKMAEWWNNESRQWAHMGENLPTARAEIARIRERRDEVRQQERRNIPFVMRAQNGELIGSISLKSIDGWNRLAWVGAWIGETTYWNGGFGTDALLLIVEYAFDWLDLRRLILMTMGVNARAQHNVKKVGFKLEYNARENTLFDGQYIDTPLYGLLREEWLGREALIERLDLRAKAARFYGKES